MEVLKKKKIESVDKNQPQMLKEENKGKIIFTNNSTQKSFRYKC